ncbi:hypothetical protein DL93DRAFT_1914709 [Clavulina sp. PMI_390]|nr:hypothetical protein DL93DRAFT_1914709 [Clavulina sp. PMI_390]
MLAGTFLSPFCYLVFTLRARMEREKERQAAAFELQPSPPTSILPSSSTGSLPPPSVSGLSFPRVWPFLHRGTESIHPKDTTDKSSAETTSTAVSAAKRASHGSWVASPSKAKRQTMMSEATAVESSSGIDGGRDSVIIIGPSVGATAFTPARRELPPIPHPIVGNGTPPQRHHFAVPPLNHPELNPYPSLFTTNPNVLSQGQDSNIPPYPYLPPFPRGDGFF